jgi:Domain of unknown function (DUF4440)
MKSLCLRFAGVIPFAIAVVASASGQGAAAADARSGGTNARLEAEVRAVERERLRALVDANLEVARRLHADDFQLINPLGQPLSKDEYLGAIASGQVDYIVWEPEEIVVRVHGDAAVIRYRARLQNVVRGQENPLGHFWHMDAYEKRNGRWQVVWSQATQIQSREADAK